MHDACAYSATISNRGKFEGAFEGNTGMVFARAVSGAKGLIYFPSSVAHSPFDKFLVNSTQRNEIKNAGIHLPVLGVTSLHRLRVAFTMAA